MHDRMTQHDLRMSLRGDVDTQHECTYQRDAHTHRRMTHEPRPCGLREVRSDQNCIDGII